MINKEESAVLTRYKKRKEQGSGAKYSVFARGHLYIQWTIERELLKKLAAHGITNFRDTRILEVGCGAGDWLRDFVSYGADPSYLHGIDLIEERLETARYLSPNISFKKCNAEQIPYPDKHFDIVFQAVVFTSILDSETKKKIADEMLRVLKDDGLIIWFDFRYNNPRNPDVKGIKKDEVLSLFNGCTLDFKSIVLAPPITRLLEKYSTLACYLPEKLPFLRTHYLTVIKKGVGQ